VRLVVPLDKARSDGCVLLLSISNAEFRTQGYKSCFAANTSRWRGRPTPQRRLLAIVDGGLQE
jgi:hypothetical protein